MSRIRNKKNAPEQLTIDSIDVENDEELDALMAQVLAEGDKIYAAQHAEAVRLGALLTNRAAY